MVIYEAICNRKIDSMEEFQAAKASYFERCPPGRQDLVVEGIWKRKEKWLYRFFKLF